MATNPVSTYRYTNSNLIKPDPPVVGAITTFDATTAVIPITPSTVPTGGGPVLGYYIYANNTRVKSIEPFDLATTITGLTAGTAYSITAEAYNADGVSARSAASLFTTTTGSVPSAPGNARFTAKGTAAQGTGTFAWAASTSSDADPVQGYRVRKNTSTTILATTTTLSADLTGLVDGDNVWVKAYNTAGQSPSSAQVTWTPQVNPGSGMAALPAGKVAGTYSIALPKTTGTYSTRSTTKAAISDIGIKHARSRYTPASNEMVARVKEFSDDLGVRWILRYGTFDESDAAQDTPAQLLTKMKADFGSTAAALGNYIAMIEGWNEPNNNGVNWIDRTIAYTKATAEALDGDNATKDIARTGFSLARIPGDKGGAQGGTQRQQSINAALAAEAIHGVTGAGLKPWLGTNKKGVTHIYPLGQIGSTSYEELTANARAGIYPAPLQMSTTEGGYFTDMTVTVSNPTPEDVVGLYVDRFLMEHILRGSFLFNQHELWDDTALGREDSFGLLRPNGTKKPAYITLKNLFGLFTDENANGTPKDSIATTAYNLAISPTPGQAGSSNKLRALLFQHSSGTYYLVLWRDENVTYASRSPYAITAKAANTITITLPSAKTVTQYKPSVQAGAVVAATSVAANGSFTVSLSDSLTVCKLA